MEMLIRTSEGLDQIFTALSKAQGEFKKAVKDAQNPYFKSKYADLESVQDATIPHLSANGLVVTQWPIEAGDDGKIRLVTILGHTSGQWMSAMYAMKPADEKPQTVGTCLSYMRRYSWAAISGVAQTDDDGNMASGRDPEKKEGLREVKTAMSRIFDTPDGDKIKEMIFTSDDPAEIKELSKSWSDDKWRGKFEEAKTLKALLDTDPVKFWDNYTTATGKDNPHAKR